MFLSDTGYRYATNLFLRFLGGVYLIAFYSLWVQIHGLIGAQGILPAAEVFDPVARGLDTALFFKAPTLLWWFNGDFALNVFCVAGLLFSVLLMAGWVPVLTSLVLWVLYLSLTIGAQVFLGYQWDNLLLEAGLLAVLVSPPVLRSRPATNPEPPRAVVFLLYWLLFRLMFAAGFVKLASGDASWTDFTALMYHPWTQPLPAWTAWYFHQLPEAVIKFSTGAVLFTELAVPFLMFTTRRLRTVAFVTLVFLQIMIAATGNFGFFNLLTVALCVMLLDDLWFENEKTQDAAVLRPWLRTALTVPTAPLAALILVVSSVQFFAQLFRPDQLPRPFPSMISAAAPFRSINNYGLFASMTKSRPEIIIEGSRDGREWRAYEFKHKPGNVRHAPGMMAPHMPRLDWQMWFASLGHYTQNRWIFNFMGRLLEGSTDVLDLLETNPFGSEPPRYIRAVLYDYRFATPEERAEKRVWWTRELKGLYAPVMSRGS
jgi:lipase maturation factor 1